MSNQQILRRLRLEFVAYVLLAVLLVVLYGTHSFAKGALAGHAGAVYAVESAGILLTIGITPLALRSYHKALIRMVYMDDDAARRRCYVKWNEIRLAMFVAIVLVNISVYYVTADNMCGYCALIGVIASLFCWPTSDGVATELTMKEEPLPEPPAPVTENLTDEDGATDSATDGTEMEA